MYLDTLIRISPSPFGRLQRGEICRLENGQSKFNCMPWENEGVCVGLYANSDLNNHHLKSQSKLIGREDDVPMPTFPTVGTMTRTRPCPPLSLVGSPKI